MSDMVRILPKYSYRLLSDMPHMTCYHSKMRILVLPKIKFIAISLTAFIAAVTVLAPLYLYQNASATSVISQLGVQYSIYNVVIQGQALDIPFQRQGMLLITQVPIGTEGTQNGVNPFEVFLISGNPGGAPESGAIWFMTNNAFLGGDSQIDLAYTTFDPETQIIAVQPDPNLSAVGANVFNARSGLLANAYQIFDGTMQIQSPDNWQTIAGQLNLLGTGAIFHSNSPYIAEISGTYAGEGIL
jgi:hypothetical protein